jgi:hypothetical protein
MGKQQQTVTYDTVKEHITQYVQKTYRYRHDIAKSLRDLEVIDLTKKHPMRDISNKKNDEKNFEQEGMDMIFEAKIKQYLKKRKL